MSYDTSRNWFYKIVGDVIQIYEKMSSAKINPDTTGKMVNLDDSSVVYPGESITNGLRIEYTGLKDANGLGVFIDKDPSSLSTDTDEDTWVNQALVNVSSPSESSHINLNSTLSLAVVDYIKAKSFERSGDLEKKEYFMREFYKKLGDNESNNRNIAISMPQGIFSVR
jgi:hypothetical protein|tara:strand:+ start:687 stop:1190 length:504 start_codon:yes stop_codon:yes gene_type:complete